jgi:hypothetical protein
VPGSVVARGEQGGLGGGRDRVTGVDHPDDLSRRKADQRRARRDPEVARDDGPRVVDVGDAVERQDGVGRGRPEVEGRLARRLTGLEASDVVHGQRVAREILRPGRDRGRRWGYPREGSSRR